MDDLERISDLRLVPVVELRAWAFSDRPSPEGPSRDHPEAWSRYWFDALADAGISGVHPIRPGSMNVETELLTDPTTLDRVVRKLTESDELDGPESASALYGGVALSSGSRILAEPSCCGGLKDWIEWRSLTEYRAPEWKIVWIGHPWLSARASGDDLVVSEPHESNSPRARWCLGRSLIKPAVDVAVAQLETFSQRLASVLRDRGIVAVEASRIARVLAGLSMLNV